MGRVLLITTASDLAADLIIVRLRDRGIPFLRFNQEDFPERIRISWPGDGQRGTLAVSEESVSCSDFRSAWFRHPVEPSLHPEGDQRAAGFISRECSGFLAGVWETAPWFWMNRPSAVALAGNKLRQLAWAREVGFHVPQTLITNCPRSAREFVAGRDRIAKTVVNAGLSEDGRHYAVYTTPISCDDLHDEAVQAAPVIFQERVANDCDLRVTVVGTRVFATRIAAQDRDGEVDWRAIDPARLSYETYRLPSALENNCIELVKAFSLSFAALDFIVTPEGRHVFLELNPSGQWGWLEAATQAPITDAIIDRLTEGPHERS